MALYLLQKNIHGNDELVRTTCLIQITNATLVTD